MPDMRGGHGSRGGDHVKLEVLTKGARVRGLAVDCIVAVRSVEVHGQDAAEVAVADARGGLRTLIVSRADKPALDLLEAARALSFDADGDLPLPRVVSDARYIGRANIFEPYVASPSSTIGSPYDQISTVYEEMLPRQSLRFVLADPGAGKRDFSPGIARAPAPSRHNAFQCEEAEWRW